MESCLSLAIDLQSLVSCLCFITKTNRYQKTETNQSTHSILRGFTRQKITEIFLFSFSFQDDFTGNVKNILNEIFTLSFKSFLHEIRKNKWSEEIKKG